MGAVCGTRSNLDDEDEDDLDALPGAGAGAAQDDVASHRAYRYRGGIVSDEDAGAVELVVARLRVDGARARAVGGDRRDAPFALTLYYRRDAARSNAADGEPGAAPEADGAPSAETRAPRHRWVSAGTRECRPDRENRGDMVVHFRERALREISRHKAPCFQLPSGFRCDAPARLVVTRLAPSKTRGQSVRGDREDDYSDSDEEEEGAELASMRSRGAKPRGGAIVAAAPHRRGARLVGEVKFSLRHLLSDARRQARSDLCITSADAGVGDVDVRVGEVVMRLAPPAITRDWDEKRAGGRPRTPAGTLSFDALLAQLRAADEEEKEKTRAPETSWTIEKKQEAKEKERRREDAREGRGGRGAGKARTRTTRAQTRERGGGNRA